MPKLPIFLQPLLLLVYWRDQLLQRFRLPLYQIARWLEQSQSQLFGPLEQAVAAMVITYLATRVNLAASLSAVRAAPPVSPVPPVLPPGSQKRPSELGPDSRLPGNPMHDAPSTVRSLALIVLTELGQNKLLISAVFLSTINLLLMFTPADLKIRLWQSWDIFWPPWQDRSAQSSADIVTSTNSDGRLPGSAAAKRESEVNVPVKERSVAGEPDSAPAARQEALQSFKEKKPEAGLESAQANKDAGAESLSKGKGKEKQSGNEGRAVLAAAKTKVKAGQTGALSAEEKAAYRAYVGQKEQAGAGVPGRKGKESGEKGSTGQAREVVAEDREKVAGVTKPEVKAAKTKDQTVDGKAAAGAGEESKRSKTREPSAGSGTTREGEIQEAKFEGEGKLRSKTAQSTPIPESTVPSTPSSSSSDSEPPTKLSKTPKSALKPTKTTRKRQSKNIHHNLFMTMRGWRPALVPFPHGMHPPPTGPRNSLWWSNVPQHAGHLMAKEKVGKEPEGLRPGDVDEEGTKARAAVERREGGREAGESEVKGKDGDGAEKPLVDALETPKPKKPAKSSPSASTRTPDVRVGGKKQPRSTSAPDAVETPKPRSLRTDAISPTQRETEHRPPAKKRGSSVGDVAAAGATLRSPDPDAEGGSDSPRRKQRKDKREITQEEKEAYLLERARRHRQARAEREGTTDVGAGSSGLTADEKADLV